MSWELKIRKVENGFIIEYPDELDDGTQVTIEEIFEYSNDFPEDKEYFKTEDTEKITLGRLLERVAEYFGNTYNGFSKDNLSITFDKVGNEIEE